MYECYTLTFNLNTFSMFALFEINLHHRHRVYMFNIIQPIILEKKKTIPRATYVQNLLFMPKFKSGSK